MRILSLFLAALLVMLCAGCTSVDSFRIPYATVSIRLDNDGLWNTYGVAAFGESRRFIKDLKVPANYSYTALSYTGYGGVLLISGKDPASDSYNTPLAYDLACPYEGKPNVRLKVNADYEAECPKCGSRFNITEASGAPVAGKALEFNYGLTRYRVVPAATGGYNIVN